MRHKIKQLPDLVRDVFSLDACNEVNLNLRKKYNLNSAQTDLLIETMNLLFFKEISVDDFIVKILKIHDDQKLAVDILGMRFLIIDDYFSGQISAQIRTLGGDVAVYASEVARQKQAITAYNQTQVQAYDTDSSLPAKTDKNEENLNVKDITEKQDAEKIFREKIATILTVPDHEDIIDILRDYDLVLLSLLSQDKELKFAKKLGTALLENQEKLTFKEFYLDNKPTRPTISNWLKDFISQYGATLPDNLQVSHYLTSSSNVKNLSASEKETVGKLLYLYRNIVFFPQSMPQNLQAWQIIPLPKITQSKIDSYKVKVKDEQSNVDDHSFASPIEQKTNKDLLAQLQQMSTQYSPDSLEHKAIEEEIAKLSDRSKF